jgi:hypothetical protein
MQRTAIITEHPTHKELHHNSLLFLHRTIQDLDEYLAGDCPSERYETYANIREQQRAHLQQVEAAHRAELPNIAPGIPRRPDGRPVLRLLVGRPVT